jgi:ABC-type transporter Mla subunit MlaD
MAENINLDVAAVLTVIANLRDKSPGVAERAMETLRLILNRDLYVPSDVHAALKPLSDKLDALLANLQQNDDQTNFRLGEIMAKIEDFDAKLKRIDDSTTEAAKVAQVVVDENKRLKGDLQKALADAGVTSEQETAILARLDRSAQAGESLVTFLKAVGKPDEPAPPAPVEPAPVEPAPDNGGGNTEPAPAEPGTPTEPTV